MPEQVPIEQFLERWSPSGAAERANYQLLLSVLCDVLGVPRPQPSTPDAGRNAYVLRRDTRIRWAARGLDEVLQKLQEENHEPE